MSAGQREFDALDIVQTRELTSREKRDLTRVWGKLSWRDGAGRFYDIVAYMWYGFAGFLGLSVLLAANRLADTAPSLSIQLALAAAGFAIALALGQWLATRHYKAKFWSERRTGDRYVMTLDGLRATGARGVFSCGWSNIDDIFNDERHLIVLLPGHGGLFIVKATFDRQEVESFSAALIRLWRANRNTPQPGPAE